MDFVTSTQDKIALTLTKSNSHLVELLHSMMNQKLTLTTMLTMFYHNITQRPEEEEYLWMNPKVMQVPPNNLEWLTIFPELVLSNFKLPSSSSLKQN